MNTDERRRELDRLTERVIGCSYEVSNTLGCGFLFGRPKVQLKRFVRDF
jgi:hypothetical protein